MFLSCFGSFFFCLLARLAFQVLRFFGGDRAAEQPGERRNGQLVGGADFVPREPGEVIFLFVCLWGVLATGAKKKGCWPMAQFRSVQRVEDKEKDITIYINSPGCWVIVFFFSLMAWLW